MDEPSIGLDVIAKTKIREVVSSMNKNGTTFILTTHDLEDVEQLADHVVIINHGKKVFDNDLQHLKSTLGNKKIVTLYVPRPYGEDKINGVPVIKSENACELSMEVDMDKQSMNEFQA